jgi:lipoate-protein ligase B
MRRYRRRSMRERAAREHAAAPAPVKVARWGRVEYAEARRRQVELVERRARGEAADLIVVVEHPAVITLGRHAPADDILCDREALARAGIALVRSDRGGRATYHGPGQAVIYPIVAIAEHGLGVKSWVALLEDSLLETLCGFGVTGRRICGQPGIWTGEGDVASSKIASIGLRVTRGVSYHGVSINVTRESKSGFAHIVTCGIRDQKVTSIEDEAPVPATVDDAATRFCDTLIRRLTNHT